MKKKIKKNIGVHFLTSPHPQYDEILDFPPRGITYEKVRTKLKYHGWISENRIRLHNFILNFLPLPRMKKIDTNKDIIHTSRGIVPLMPKKPWVMDIECGHVFTSFNWKAMKNKMTSKIIRKAFLSDKCKKILPQSEAAKKNLLLALDCRGFENKIQVLYLAMRPCKQKRINRKDNHVVLSFIGKSFYDKGAHNLLIAYEKLLEKYKNLKLKFKGDVPKEYQRFLKLPGVEFVQGHLLREKLFDKMYLNSDIFVFPTHIDNYGVVVLEAMSAGLPIVGTTSMTIPELCEDGKNGFIIKTNLSWENYIPYNKEKEYREKVKKVDMDIVTQLVEKLSILIEDKKLREKMGQESRRMIEVGKFSIKERNKKLKQIYEEALK